MPNAVPLAYDKQVKTALHTFVIVIPLAILIFAEALQNPKELIELPILRLKLEIEAILPLFLLILSYMLYRAMRFARIVLFGIPLFPEQMNQVAQISLDDTEAYKMNSPHYDEVIDPMAAGAVKLLTQLNREWVISFGWYSFVSLNVFIALILYSAIFGLLAVISLYASEALFSLAVAQRVLELASYWPFDPIPVMERLILCLSGALLFLTWLNAAPIVLAPFAAIGGGAVAALALCAVRGVRMWRHLALRFPGVIRTKVKPEKADPTAEDFPSRVELFKSAYALWSNFGAIEKAFGKEVLHEGVGLTSEWYSVQKHFGFLDIRLCCVGLASLAYFAPIRFVKKDALNIFHDVESIIDDYRQASSNQALSTAAELTAVSVRLRNSSIAPRDKEAQKLFHRTKRALEKMDVDLLEGFSEAREYFGKAGLISD